MTINWCVACSFSNVIEDFVVSLCIGVTGVQSAGDCVILKGETLHWVRALGFSSNFSWNFGLLESSQLELASQRQAENDRITESKDTNAVLQSIVPVKTLLLDIIRLFLSHAPATLASASMLSTVTKTPIFGSHWVKSCGQDNCKRVCLLVAVECIRCVCLLEEQLTQLVTAMGQQPEIELPDAVVVYCDSPLCRCELFEAYLHCPRKCGYLCLRCALKSCLPSPSKQPPRRANATAAVGGGVVDVAASLDSVVGDASSSVTVVSSSPQDSRSLSSSSSASAAPVAVVSESTTVWHLSGSKIILKSLLSKLDHDIRSFVVSTIALTFPEAIDDFNSRLHALISTTAPTAKRFLIKKKKLEELLGKLQA